jgi:Ca2+-binding RTX toxin-like protein
MSFHLYDVNEIYSNADGTVQFIELVVGNFAGENGWQGQRITVTQGATTHQFTFPVNLPSTTTNNTSVLIATQGFADLGLIQPDFIVPAGFLFVDGGTVNFAGADSVVYPALPGGTLSIDRNGVSGTNSPKNFAGATASFEPEPTFTIVPPTFTIVGDAGNNNLFGTGGVDAINSAGGADVVVAAAGNDTGYGGDGNDYLYLGDGDDIGFGEAGIDVFVMGLGNDTASGGTDQDYIYGGDGNDAMYGDDGVDVLIGEAGNDSGYGGAGGDYFYLGPDDDFAFGGEGNDISVLEAGNDTGIGGAGQDYFYMGDGNDLMNGGSGVDVLLGEAGNDTFSGGLGVDYLFLGPGGANDSDAVFVDRDLSGVHVVNGFEAGGTNDVINLTNSGMSTFAQVRAATSDFSASGGFIVITLDADTNIWLIGVTPAQLTAGDFLFDGVGGGGITIPPGIYDY